MGDGDGVEVVLGVMFCLFREGKGAGGMVMALKWRWGWCFFISWVLPSVCITLGDDLDVGVGVGDGGGVVFRRWCCCFCGFCPCYVCSSCVRYVSIPLER